MPSYVLDITTKYKDQGTVKGIGGVRSELGGLAAAGGKLLAGGLAIGGAALVAFGAKAIQLGSDAAETKSKFNTVFKDMADEVGRWSDNVANSMGLTKAESKGMLASVQDLLVPFGFARDKAADLSKQVLTLSGDLASFNNLNTADVLADINSALVGETDGMKKYGVVVNAAAIEQEALNLGLVKNKDELDNVTKAQATLSLIMKGTTDAQGDLARTQDGFANQMKQTKAVFTDIATEIGENLVPVFLPLLQNFNTWTQVHLPAFVQSMKDNMASVKKNWDDDWGHIRSTWNDFRTNLPKEQDAFWVEWNRAFTDGSQEHEMDWEGFWERVTTGAVGTWRLNLANFTEFLGGMRSGLQGWGLLAQGDWDGAWQNFSESLGHYTDIMLNYVEFNFGVDLRDALTRALHLSWDALGTWGENIISWWKDFWGQFKYNPAVPQIPNLPQIPEIPVYPPYTPGVPTIPGIGTSTGAPGPGIGGSYTPPAQAALSLGNIKVDVFIDGIRQSGALTAARAEGAA